MNSGKVEFNIFRCPLCNAKLIDGPQVLMRHIRIVHGRDMSQEQIESFLAEEHPKIPETAPNLSKLSFITRRPVFVGVWGACDICCKSSARRWQYEKTTRGDVVVCVDCRERMNSKKRRIDALDSFSRLPGSYGG